MSSMFRKAAAGVAAVAALALGGAAVAGATTSGTGGSGSSSASTPAAAARTGPGFRGSAHGTPAHENAEKAVTGDAAAKAQAAAVKSVGGGTAGPVTTDLTGQGYETTVTKSDGTKVEVHLDHAFAVMTRPPGDHRGGPGDHRGEPGDHPGMHHPTGPPRGPGQGAGPPAGMMQG
ncbi:MAG TPA: hypothetical protein VFN55_05450 [Solirubrobacteraceae bacterium]|nr:hypothetical protein [Solirubrobacteraceae bacterium]